LGHDARVSVDLDIAPPSAQPDVARFEAIASQSLGVPAERMPLWTERITPANLRLVRHGGAVVAGLGLLPMGHWFGGRAVPCVGITAVSVAPEHRSRGIAGEMMRTALEEAQRDGVALSSLFPATYPVYRAAGYESAGNRLVYRIPLGQLGPGAKEPAVREVGSGEHGLLRALYDARARTSAGLVERTRYFWTRVHEPWKEDARAYVVEGDDGPEGYLVVWYQPLSSALAANEVNVRDVVVRTPAAAQRILRFLGDHRSIAKTVSLVAGPGDPLLLNLREERVEVTDVQRCMLRIVDVRAAMEKRGWSPAVRGEVHLAVRDAVLPHNARRWVLEVEGGRAEVREGGSGGLAIDVRGLASLYSGYLGAEELRVAGLCDGDDAELARASGLFAGPAPWLADHF
jgi:predicted acetyltransferase